jgi:MoaA/NifB/PqqE/SkfB family radical SAM enzyme
MIEVLNFIKQYANLYDQDKLKINFTGGEPTNNPIFFEFAEYAKKETNYDLGLTTNGAFSPKFIDLIEKNFSWVTVSYHVEAAPKLKETVLKNIKLLKERNIRLQVNVMMHADYWEECVNVCDTLTSLEIKFNPRPIGDGEITIKGWFQDADGSMRRTSHEYSKEQQEWYFSFMGLSVLSEEAKQGTKLGRNCCGGRCVQGKVNNQWQEVKLVDTNFKDWYCSVNKYFLHIDHETETVYHHQTCQAKFDNQRGSIGSLKDTASILDYVKQNKNNIIVCPNQRCGCGMCVPKSKEYDEYIKL